MKSKTIAKTAPSSKTFVMPKYMTHKIIKSTRTIRLRYADYQIVFRRLMRLTRSVTKCELAEAIGITPSAVSNASLICHLPFSWLIKLQFRFGILPHTVLEGFEI